MKLADLEPQFLMRAEEEGKYLHVDTLPDAQGMSFICPGCGEHSILTWFRDKEVPESEEPKGRWAAHGSSYADLSLTPSVSLAGGCKWHGFVLNGTIVTA